jgi:hypothetical protein
MIAIASDMARSFLSREILYYKKCLKCLKCTKMPKIKDVNHHIKEELISGYCTVNPNVAKLYYCRVGIAHQK